MSVALRFPSASAFDGARALVARVERTVGELGHTWEVVFPLALTPRAPPKGRRRPGAQPSNAQVAAWFTFGTTTGQPGRDFFVAGEGVRDHITSELVARFVGDAIAGRSTPNAGALMLSLGYRYRALVLARFESGGGGLSIAPLSPSHVAHKLSLGYPARPGTMTGQLARALRAAQPIARRTG